MEQMLVEQLLRWHEEDEHEQIVDTISSVPPAERSYSAISYLARALNNLERYEEALQQLILIKDEGKGDALWHFRIGYAYHYMHQAEEALHAFEQADLLAPGDSATQIYLKQCRRQLQSKQMLQHNLGSASASLDEFDDSQFWEDSEYALNSYVSEPPTDDMIAAVEQELGYKLPKDYITLMKRHNGGVPINTCFPTTMATSWAEDHIAISGIMGIGHEKSYSLCGDLGSRFMIEEWGYPDIGVVFGDCPSAGHDVIMLDYRACGPEGEPAVIHVDQEDDYAITFLAPTFAAFIQGLVHDEVYDTSEEDKQADLHKVATAPFSPLLSQLCENVQEIEDIEAIIRTICTAIVEDKGHFSLHADERSLLMYDLQFWLYTKCYNDVTREQYLAAYDKMIAFGGAFSTGGYAPGFISDWLDNRVSNGAIIVQAGTGILQLSASTESHLLDNLRAVSVRGG